MAGLDALAGVGGATPDSEGGVGNALQSIVMANYLRGALLGLGQPTWGGAGNAIYNAAAGATNAGGDTQEAAGKEGVRQAESAQNAQLTREQMASHENVAKITGASREQAAEIRGRYGIDRAHVMLSRASAGVGAKYMKIAEDSFEKNFQNMNVDPLTKSQMIREDAARLYAAAVDMGAEKEPEGGAPASHPVPAGAEPAATSATGTAEPSAGGGVVPAKKPAAGAKGGPSAGDPALITKAMSDPTQGKNFTSKMSTPAGQQELIKTNPDLKPHIDAWNAQQTETARRKNVDQSAPHNLLRGLFGQQPSE